MEKQKLQSQTFNTHKELIDWANSKDGTDYIISIVFVPINMKWTIFYIK